MKEREEAIFEAARNLPFEERAAYVAQACRGDEGSRGRILKKLGLADMPARDTSASELSSALTLTITPLTEAPGERAGTRIGHYKLLQTIGEGGMGTVWMADQEEPVRRRVALKVIKLGMDTKHVIGRFEAERQALALMDHPGIAKVLDAGATENGRPYFVMELVKGVPITRYCDQHKLNTDERLKLFVLVCHAVQHAHQKGIIHRDIKPSNILVTLQEDGQPTPKIIDFGIAKATAGQSLTDKTVFTAFEQFIGTPAYMSPEQAAMTAVDIDTRSDIYSLGVLIYEILTGNTPFDSKRLVQVGLDEVRRIIREEDPPRPSTRLSTLEADEQTTVAKSRQSDPPQLIHLVRGDLDWIVMKCLEKDRTRRYQTANGLALDIQRHLSFEPVLARPPTHLYRLQRFVLRNKLAFFAGLAVGTALLIGLGTSTWLFLKEKAAHQQAAAAERAEHQARQEAEAARQNEARHRSEAEASERQARIEANKNQHAEALFREALRLIREYSTPDQATDSYISAVMLHHLADLLRTRDELDEARTLAGQATAMFRRHPDWPASEEQHALEVLALVFQSKADSAALEALYPELLAASQKLLTKPDIAAVRSLHRSARVFASAGFPKEAHSLYARVVEGYRARVENDDVAALNGLAWLLATCDDAAIRNGPRAVTLAERAVELTQRHGANELDTLAAAYAEIGRFDSAIRVEEEAMALMPSPTAKEAFNPRLKLYAAGRPFHE